MQLRAAQDEQPAEQAPVQQAVPAVKEKQSLLAATAKARKHMPQETAAEKQRRDEEAMMQALTRNTALKSVQELATVGAACRAWLFANDACNSPSQLALSADQCLLSVEACSHPCCSSSLAASLRRRRCCLVASARVHGSSSSLSCRGLCP